MSDSLKDRLQSDLNEARKARDKLRTLALSMTLSELRNREIELGAEADDSEALTVVSKAVKRRKEAAEQMQAGGRPELAEKEEAEAEILSRYLPEGLSEEVPGPGPAVRRGDRAFPVQTPREETEGLLPGQRLPVDPDIPDTPGADSDDQTSRTERGRREMANGHGHCITGSFLFHHAGIIADEDKYTETVRAGQGPV